MICIYSIIILCDVYLYGAYAEIKKNPSREHSVITAASSARVIVWYTSHELHHTWRRRFLYSYFYYSVAPAAYSSSSSTDTLFCDAVRWGVQSRRLLDAKWSYGGIRTGSDRAHARLSFWTWARPMGLRGVRGRCVNRYSRCATNNRHRRPMTGSTLGGLRRTLQLDASSHPVTISSTSVVFGRGSGDAIFPPSPLYIIVQFSFVEY